MITNLPILYQKAKDRSSDSLTVENYDYIWWIYAFQGPPLQADICIIFITDSS